MQRQTDLHSSERRKKAPIRWPRLQKRMAEREILGDSKREKETGRTGRKEESLEETPGRSGEWERMTWSSSSQSPKKGYFYIVVLEPLQCQYPASRACVPSSYTATGVGRHDDHPPASSCPRCSTFWGKPAEFPPCQPVTPSSGLSQGTLLGHSNMTGACGDACCRLSVSQQEE